MALYALADLHLGQSVDKPMDVFGQAWENHPKKIQHTWLNTVRETDVVLVPGDISWAMTLQEAKEDLDWIADLPGTKVMIRGNHDYWWHGITKVRRSLDKGLLAIQNDAVRLNEITVCGTRGWVIPSHPKFSPEDDTIYRREAERLRLSLQQAASLGRPIVAMIHYPPCSQTGESTLFTDLLEQFEVAVCVYGHLHGPAHRFAYEGEKAGVRYQLVSADYTGFAPVCVDIP